ncbi:MAG: hypothetical protein ACKV2Q_28085 [Planctomycetaceae bacterium]
MTQNQSSDHSPAALVAIIRAARMAADKELEKAAKQELSERFGITLTFASKSRFARKEAPSHA